MTEYVYNPLFNKTPAGPSRAGGAVTYTVKAAHSNPCDNVYLMLTDDADKSVKQIRMPLVSRDAEFNIFRVTINYERAGLYWYHFKMTKSEYTWYLCKTPSFNAEARGDMGSAYAQIVTEKPIRENKQFTSGIIYHIFVDRFYKSGDVAAKRGMKLRRDWGGSITKNTPNLATDPLEYEIINRECFGGNLLGIVDKLSYIKGLGASAILLSPVFESNSYHKYDTADLENVDSMFGGDAALKTLVAEAKRQGIGIILDGVFNHCGSDSIYFNRLGNFNSVGAYQSRKSKYFDWFTFEKFPDAYSSWWGFDTLPQFNESNPALQKFIAGPGGVIEKYMKTGILGFRADVADELSDVYLDKICARIRAVRRDAVIMGEVWEDAATKIAYGKRRHYFAGGQLGSVMNYPLKNAIIDFVTKGDSEGLASVFYMLRDHYPREVAYGLMNFLGTHDTKRILTVLREKDSDAKNAFNMLKIASAILYCSPGVPAVFYGDEAGAFGGEAPFCRVCYPWGKEDKATLAWYRKLGELRASSVLVDGDCNILFAHNGVFIMERVIMKASKESKGASLRGAVGDEAIANRPTKYASRLILAANCAAEDFKLNVASPMTDFETGKPVKDSIIMKPQSFVVLT